MCLRLRRDNSDLFGRGRIADFEAYEEAFGFGPKQTEAAREVLAQYGNMSSATVYFVLEQVMQKPLAPGYGLLVALGPGFSAEMVLLKWEG